jgi:redox-sensitive bicupin YhaK (pirin superfamily)
MSNSPILRQLPLDFQWPTLDPFLFCVHHEDHYPKGNDDLGPEGTLAGRNIGQDFEPRNGWRMYHGDRIPGFPVHPHRGFETVTVVQTGMVDHADSMGAAGRYGGGDTQWMTAGKGVQHSEMFPLLSKDNENPLELFQIWLNLPQANKFVEPHFAMLWADAIPRLTIKDSAGHETEVEIIAGKLDQVSSLSPPPDSWAADPEHHVAIWMIRMQPGAAWTLPATGAGINRVLYFFDGESMQVAGNPVKPKNGLVLQPDTMVELENGDREARLLLLQGKPIDEPVVQYGPFVMNTRQEIQQAFTDYQQTQFGGWPWPDRDQVHGRDKGRFARHADGKEESRAD